MKSRRNTIYNTPQPLQHPTYIRTPADVHYSVAWRIVMAMSALIGMRWVMQRRWGRILGAMIAGRYLWRYARHTEPQTPALRHVTIQDTRIPPGFQGFRIGQISDIHLGQPYSHQNLAWAIAQMKQANPDLIVLTGDLVNDRESIGELPYYLRQLHAPYGVYAIPGNHDYVEQIDDVKQALAFAGIPMLCNQGFVIHHDGDEIYLAGVDDIWHGQLRLDQAMANNTTHMPTVLLAHSPDIILEAIDYPHLILQLSGHVHGGHLRVPLLGPLARPRYGRRYTHGTQRVHHVWMHISLGLSGRQLRIGNPPEVGIITLSHHQGGV